MNNILEVKNLSKAFNGFSLKNISFSLPKGYIMGLIGPNGAGKTTTIKLILNMLKRTSGEIKVFDKNNISYENKIKEGIGVVFDSNFYVEDWTVSDIEKSVGIFYNKWDSSKFRKLITKFGLVPDKKVRELSKGMQMKLMLACAFTHDAKLLILDEPTSGLDPVARDELLDILSEYISDGERSVLFSTHITSDLGKIADYITYLNNGELFYTGIKDEFVDSFRIVKGGKGEISSQQKTKVIGLRCFSTGFEGLIKKEDIIYFRNMSCEPVTIDDVIIFITREGANND